MVQPGNFYLSQETLSRTNSGNKLASLLSGWMIPPCQQRASRWPLTPYTTNNVAINILVRVLFGPCIGRNFLVLPFMEGAFFPKVLALCSVLCLGSHSHLLFSRGSPGPVHNGSCSQLVTLSTWRITSSFHCGSVFFRNDGYIWIALTNVCPWDWTLAQSLFSVLKLEIWYGLCVTMPWAAF